MNTETGHIRQLLEEIQPTVKEIPLLQEEAALLSQLTEKERLDVMAMAERSVRSEYQPLTGSPLLRAAEKFIKERKTA